MQKATRQQTKEHNRNLVLKTIFEHTRISRAEISRLTSLTRTTVSDIVSDLMTMSLVEEVGVGSSLGGKSPILLSLVDDSRFLIGLDLAQNQFHGAVVNLRGKIKEMVSLPVNNRNGDEALALVFDIIDQLIKPDFQPLVGISVGTPGLVNMKEGVVVNAVNLDWQNLPLAQLVQARYQLPVFVLNDSQAAAMGEYTHTDGRDIESNLVVINAGHGIGAGVVINGKLFQGDGGGAGEIGHVVVVREGGLLCRCGNYGCLETVASAQAVVQRARLLAYQNPPSMQPYNPDAITLASLEQAFAAGDPLACQVILEAGYYLGLTISSLIGTLNIHNIILSGDMTRFGEPWLAAVRQAIAATSFSLLARDTCVEIGQLSSNQVVLGASAQLLSDYSLLYTQ